MKTSTISIVALCLLGIFVAPVMAAKPIPDQDIFLSAGPVRPPWTCDVYNSTDLATYMQIRICIDNADNGSGVLCQGPLAELKSERILGLVLDGSPAESAICEVTYTGKPGEITGTFCGSNGCLQLQPQ